ncbi:MAG: transporter [Armatimonadetes bacterium]|nr:transporter [Armatimonadota bacterium]
MNKQITRLSLVASAVLATASASACSVCIAHAIGAGLQAIGAQVLEKNHMIVGISYESFSKSQDGGTLGTTEKHDQTQMSIDLLKGLNDQVMLRASIPYVYKRLSATGESPIDTQGLGDITLGATYQIKPKTNQKVLLGTTLDLKLPTGKNNLTDINGDRMDEHTQLGTGSTDLSFGLLATMEGGESNLWFAGLTSRWNGRNGTGYHYGNTVFYNVGMSHTLSADSSVVLEFNGRMAARDRMEDGTLDGDSGGHFGYLSVSYRRALGQNTGLIASYQIPVVRQLNGSQTETGLLTIGVFTKV